MTTGKTAPLLVLKPAKDSPETKARWLHLCLGMVAVVAILAAPFVLHLTSASIKSVDSVTSWVGIGLGFFLFFWFAKRGGFHQHYEFYADHMKLKHLNFEGKSPDKERRAGYERLDYMWIEGVEGATNPYSPDGRLVDIHVKIISLGPKSRMRGWDYFDKEFYLYRLPAADNPEARVREIIDAYFKNNPDRVAWRQRMQQEEQLQA